MKQCRECGTFSTDETVFCSICGTKFSEIPDIVSNNVEIHVVSENAVTAHHEIAPLLQRIDLFLEDGEFERADDYCERVLDTEPTNAEAYIDKLLVEFKCNIREQLKNCSSTIADSKNYTKAIRFGNESQKAFLEDAEETVQKRLVKLTEEHVEQERLTAEEHQQMEPDETDEYYIDVYCPFCHEELSYINWQIEEGDLICPMCNGKFEFSEEIRR